MAKTGTSLELYQHFHQMLLHQITSQTAIDRIRLNVKILKCQYDKTNHPRAMA